MALHGPQFGRARARIAANFLIRCRHRFAGQQSEAGRLMEHLRGMPRGLCLTAALFGHELFDDPVFQGMKGNDHQAPAFPQDTGGRVQGAFELAQFIIDGNPQGLKGACRRMDLVMFEIDNLGDQSGELGRCLDGSLLPRLDNRARHGA